MLEVGPGLGVLTRYLAERVAHVHAAEVDRRLEPQLAAIPSTDLHWGDALRLDLAALEPRAAQARRQPAVQHRDAARRREPRARRSSSSGA